MSTLDQLWERYRSDRSEANRNALAVALLPLVQRIAGKMQRKLPLHAEFDDLAADGSIGLLKAIERFNLDLGFTFQTFAGKCIFGSIVNGLRDRDHLTRYERKRLGAAAPLLLSGEDEDVAMAVNGMHDSQQGQAVIDNADEVRWLIAALPHKYHDLLYMRWFDGMTVSEISQAVGRSGSWVVNRLCVIVRILRCRAARSVDDRVGPSVS